MSLPYLTNHKSCILIYVYACQEILTSTQQQAKLIFFLSQILWELILYISSQLRNLAFKKIPQKSGSASSSMTLSGIASDLLNPASRDPSAPSEGWQQWKQRDEQVPPQLVGCIWLHRWSGFDVFLGSNVTKMMCLGDHSLDHPHCRLLRPLTLADNLWTVRGRPGKGPDFK